MDEVFNNKQMLVGIEELKKVLLQLQQNETIILMKGDELKGVEQNSLHIKIPPDSILNNLIAFCKSRNLQVLGNQKSIY